KKQNGTGTRRGGTPDRASIRNKLPSFSTLFYCSNSRSNHPAKLKLTWKIRNEWEEWSELTEGTYILRTNIEEWSDEQLWRTYIQLSEAEAAFRIHKSDLCIRPIWHHKQNRIKAHILICFLAYALWKTLQKWQCRAGLGDSPRTILTELSRIHSADIV